MARSMGFLALVLVLLAAAPAHASAAGGQPRVVLAFLPSGGDDNPKPVLERLEERTPFALGLASATQGRFSRAQMVLDITAGSRTSRAVYTPQAEPDLELVPGGDGTGFVFGCGGERVFIGCSGSSSSSTSHPQNRNSPRYRVLTVVAALTSASWASHSRIDARFSSSRVAVRSWASSQREKNVIACP